MATLVATFVLTGSNAEGFVATAGANSTLTAVAGGLQSTLGTASVTNNNNWVLTTTWQGANISVPANSVITGVTTASMQSQCTAFTHGASSTSGAVTLHDSVSGTNIILSTQRTFTTTDASAVTTNGTDSTGLFLHSADAITITILNTLVTTAGGSPANTLLQLNITFTVTYQPDVVQSRIHDTIPPLGSSWEKRYQNDLRTFAHGPALLLRNLDRQFAGPGQWKTYDYPDPLGSARDYPADLRTFAAVHNELLVGAKMPGVGTFDLPTPRPPAAPSRFLRSYGVLTSPVVNDIFDVPATPTRQPDLQTWIASYDVENTVGSPPGDQSFDIPRVPLVWLLNRSYGSTSGISYFFGSAIDRPAVISPPLVSYWVLGSLPSTVNLPTGDQIFESPASRPYPIDLRTWTLSYSLENAFPVGDQTFWLMSIGPGQIDLRTWLKSFSLSVPTSPIGSRVFDLPTPSQPILQSYQLSSIKPPVSSYFATQLSDRPSLNPYLGDLKTWVFTSQFDVGAKPSGNQTFDSPATRPYPVDLQTWLRDTNIYSVIVNLPAGDQSFALPPLPIPTGLLAKSYKPSSSTIAPYFNAPTFDLPQRNPYLGDLSTWAYRSQFDMGSKPSGIGFSDLPPLSIPAGLQSKPYRPSPFTPSVSTPYFVPQAFDLPGQVQYQTDLRTWSYNTIIQNYVLMHLAVVDYVPTGSVNPYQNDLRAYTYNLNIELAPTQVPLPITEDAYDLPPLGYYRAYSNDLRTYIFSTELTLLQVPLPVTEDAYDLPPLGFAQAYHAQLRSWSFSYDLNLIGKDILPSGKQTTELTPLAIRTYRNDLQTWTESGIYFEPIVFAIGSRSVFETPIGSILPYHVQLRNWLNSYDLSLIGKDNIPIGKETFDLTPLTPRPYTNDLRSWLASGMLFEPVVFTVGKELFDLTPIGPYFSIELRTWGKNYDLSVVGQDKLAAGTQFYERPDPKTLPRIFLDIIPNNSVLFPKPIPPGGSILDTQLGSMLPFSNQLRTWLANNGFIGVIPIGTQIFDRPNPKTLPRIFFDTLTNTLVTVPVFPIGDQTFDRTDPKTLPRIILDVPTNEFLTIPRRLVGNSIYELPRRPFYPDDLRAVLSPLKLNLIGQDQRFFVYDYPNPKYPPRELFDWVNTLNPNFPITILLRPSKGYGLRVPRVVFGSLLRPEPYGLLVPKETFGVLAFQGPDGMPVLPDLPAVLPKQVQTLFIDFGKFLPPGTILSGLPTLNLGTEFGADPLPNSRVSIGPTIGTVAQSLGGSGITNTAILWQVSNCLGGVIYSVDIVCPRSDGDVAEASTRFPCSFAN